MTVLIRVIAIARMTRSFRGDNVRAEMALNLLKCLPDAMLNRCDACRILQVAPGVRRGLALKSERKIVMKEFLWFAAVLVAWFVANRWVLPAFGVKT